MSFGRPVARLRHGRSVARSSFRDGTHLLTRELCYQSCRLSVHSLDCADLSSGPAASGPSYSGLNGCSAPKWPPDWRFIPAAMLPGTLPRPHYAGQVRQKWWRRPSLFLNRVVVTMSVDWPVQRRPRLEEHRPNAQSQNAVRGSPSSPTQPLTRSIESPSPEGVSASGRGAERVARC